MRALCCLLLASCLLLCHPGPGMGAIGQGYPDRTKCFKEGGFCHFYYCPLKTDIIGTCYNGTTKCCRHHLHPRDPHLV
ncbi:beta-defensin 11-like [Talpa occidentalis]|uniref:beta-defensin 11-like n=1 Tax=Talpa occidentalis TaxID=50954 RepID=UPI0023F8FA88|nr:beta-defensin 11-like [Talpa occidentalis]